MTADSTVAEIEAAGGTALGIEVDVRDQEAVGAMVARVVQEWGGVDVLVANEGGVGATRHLTVRPRAATNIADRVGAAGPMLSTR
jgi:NAD(P)-dependent dehydrogenase (short-subunit alcohol dehydrogenase family)